MLIPCALLLLGFVLIVVAADDLVRTSSFIAKTFNISPMIIGLTIVALGTSAPEIIVSITASLDGQSELALGNAIGSNIANIGLVLGLSLLLKPIKIQSKTLLRELPILFIIMCCSYLLLADGYFSRHDGLLLLIGLGLLLFYIAGQANKSRKDSLASEVTAELPASCRYPYFRLIVSLILLPISAKLIVNNSIVIASYLGVSKVTIGLTVVAIGTSLPEVATSIVGILKGEDDLAIGNIIGSNMFNLLAVLPFAGMLAPKKVPPLINVRDIPIMFLVSIFVVILVYMSKHKLGRLSGILLLSIYIAYLVLLKSSGSNVYP